MDYCLVCKPRSTAISRSTEYLDLSGAADDIDVVAAGAVAYYGHEPDWRFFDDPSFQQLAPDQRTIVAHSLVSGAQGDRHVMALGTVHDHDPSNTLFDQVYETWHGFTALASTGLAKVIVEGRVRNIDPAVSYHATFRQHGEVGLIEALATKRGFEVVDAEPGVNGLRLMAREYGAPATIDYLCLRMVPQWCRMGEGRPALSSFIIDTLVRLAHLDDYPEFTADDYGNRINALYSYREINPDDPYTTAFALSQTTHEYALRTPEYLRTPVQHIAIAHNMQRDRRLLHDALTYANDGFHTFIVGGDVHVRAIQRAF